MSEPDDVLAAGADEAERPPRLLTVVGHGAVQVAADTAVLTVGLSVRRPSPSEALTEVSSRAERVLAALREAGVPQDAVETTDLAVTPIVEAASNRVSAYEAAYDLAVTLRDLEQGPGAIDRISGAAGDALRLAGFRLVAAPSQAEVHEAAARAVSDAMGRAERLAGAAGLRLGRVLSVADGAGGPGQRGPMAVSARATARPPIEGGSSAVTAAVTVTFELAG